MKNIKKIILILNILLTQLLFSQTVFKFNILKTHSYDIYSDENLQLILDKTNSSYFFSYLPSQTGDPIQFSEGSFIISNKTLIFSSKITSNYNPKLFRDLSELKFKLKRKKIIPIINSDYRSYFIEPLCKSTFKEYPNLVYIKE
jgi:hypothetical protein